MITIPPNRAAAEFHDRMPAILERENIKNWIIPHLSDPERVNFLRQHPCLPEHMKISELRKS
jgi:putative SOS response-associated peptidase YedK